MSLVQLSVARTLVQTFFQVWEKLSKKHSVSVSSFKRSVFSIPIGQNMQNDLRVAQKFSRALKPPTIVIGGQKFPVGPFSGHEHRAKSDLLGQKPEAVPSAAPPVEATQVGKDEDFFWAQKTDGDEWRTYNLTYPLVICHIAIENGHRHSGFSH